MALRKPLFIDAEGFPTEMSPGSDSVAFEAITVYGSAGIAMVSGTVSGLPEPTADDHAATKLYVDTEVGDALSDANAYADGVAAQALTDANAYTDGIAQGLDIKQSVRAVSFSNLDLNGTETVDGVSLQVGDRVLVAGQTAPAENGIYVVSAGAWSRSADANSSADVTAGMFTFVSEGTAYADTGWVLSTNDTVTLGTTPLTFTQFSSAGILSAGSGLTKTGNTLDVGAGDGISVAADSVAVLLGTDPGLEFVSGALEAKVSGVVTKGAAGLDVSVDGTTVDNAGDELSVLGVPALFTIDGVAVGATVTAPNLTELTDGSLTDLHTHAGTDDALDSLRVTNEYTTDGVGVTAGDPVYLSGNGIVSEALAATTSANKVLGVARTTVGASAAVDVVSDGRLNGVLSGATAGDHVYLAPAGGLTSTRPTGAGERITLVGWAVNATDLHVEINFLGRNA